MINFYLDGVFVVGVFAVLDYGVHSLRDCNNKTRIRSFKNYIPAGDKHLSRG